jgi:hypothetical protein
MVTICQHCMAVMMPAQNQTGFPMEPSVLLRIFLFTPASSLPSIMLTCKKWFEVVEKSAEIWEHYYRNFSGVGFTRALSFSNDSAPAWKKRCRAEKKCRQGKFSKVS